MIGPRKLNHPQITETNLRFIFRLNSRTLALFTLACAVVLLEALLLELKAESVNTVWPNLKPVGTTTEREGATAASKILAIKVRARHVCVRG